MIIVCDTLTSDKGTIFFRHTQDFTRMGTTQKLRTALQYLMELACLVVDIPIFVNLFQEDTFLPFQPLGYP